MKNRFRITFATIIAISFASIMIAVLCLVLMSYIAYKVFNIWALRSTLLTIQLFFINIFGNTPFWFLSLIILGVALTMLVGYLFAKVITTRMNEIEQAKNDFIVNIAHDLRTPLTSVIGYLSIIREQNVAPEESRQYADIAFEKSKQLERLIESLFEAVHFTLDTAQMHKDEIDFYRFLLQIKDEYYPLLENAGMEMRLKVETVDLTICADGDWMARVFDNLIQNAIRYAKEGKYVDIEAKNLHDQLRISVVTHANPIPVDELKRIFGKLYRLEKSRATNTGGTGLGLTISRQIIELHGGKINARQTATGTSFDITLPNKEKYKVESS